MTVEINTERKGVEVRWDPAAGVQSETAQVFARGEEDDWHNTAVGPNDGLASLSYPHDFKGESYVEVRDGDGNVIDSGTIEVD